MFCEKNNGNIKCSSVQLGASCCEGNVFLVKFKIQRFAQKNK